MCFFIPHPALALSPSDAHFLLNSYSDKSKSLERSENKSGQADLPQNLLENGSWKSLSSLEGSHLIFKISGPQGEKWALKISHKKEVLSGEHFSAKLAQHLGLAFFVDSTFLYLNEALRNKIKQNMPDIPLDSPMKQLWPKHLQKAEYAKRKNLLEIQKALQQGLPLYGLLKPWVANLQFSKILGSPERWREKPFLQIFQNSGLIPSFVELKQCSFLEGEKKCVLGPISSHELRWQLAQIFWIDALANNQDRFAGANLHFRLIGPMQAQNLDSHTLYFPQIELTALDNGGSFLEQQRFKFSNEVWFRSKNKTASTEKQNFVFIPKKLWFQTQALLQKSKQELIYEFLVDLPNLKKELAELMNQVQKNARALIQSFKENQDLKFYWIEPDKLEPFLWPETSPQKSDQNTQRWFNSKADQAVKPL